MARHPNTVISCALFLASGHIVRTMSERNTRMTNSIRSMMLAASIFALPAAVLAQTTTAPTADQSRLGTPNAGPSAYPTAGTPGSTGTTVVPGNNSTVGGDRSGTAMSKTGGAGGASGAAEGGSK
jgi:hypothetical protein